MCPNDNISKEEMIIRANRDAVCALIVRVNQATSEEIPQGRQGCRMCPNGEFLNERMKKMIAYQSTLDPFLILTEFEFCHNASRLFDMLLYKHTFNKQI